MFAACLELSFMNKSISIPPETVILKKVTYIVGKMESGTCGEQSCFVDEMKEKFRSDYEEEPVIFMSR